jgi:exonuclease VII large subunit
MRSRLVLLALIAMATAPWLHAENTNDLIRRLQDQVTTLSTQVRAIQSTLDQNAGVMKETAQKNTDNVTALDTRLKAVEDALQQQKAGAETCADVTSQSSKALRDNLADLQNRLAQVSRQLDALRNAPPPANNVATPATESNPTAANPAPTNNGAEQTGKTQAQTTIPH